MRSVGEVMGIGRTLAEALLKAISSLEGGYADASRWDDQTIRDRLATATPRRLPAVFEALRRQWDPSEITEVTGIDRWFLAELGTIISAETSLRGRFLHSVSAEELRRAKRLGMPDAHIALILDCTPQAVAARRKAEGIQPVFKRVDTCGAEFESHTPYLYSTYEDECEAGESETERVVILGNGPNRIGQGLEFDYCCCHAAYAVQEAGYTSVMVNCNPETVSTDYDTADKLYFEPVTIEHVQAVLDREAPKGSILQFGGQTPLKLSHSISPILGTGADAIDLCEDRERFNQLLNKLGIRQPDGALAYTASEALALAEQIGFPVLLRPSYVLGGRGMVICDDMDQFRASLQEAIRVSEDHPVLLDRFLDNAVEYDVDALCDGEDVWIAAIMEHIEEAGVHSGDSTTVIPAPQLSDDCREEMEASTRRLALELGVLGLVNVQYAVQNDTVYVIEVNPRASRTVPFVSKATGVQIARLATRICLGEKLSNFDLSRHGAGMWFIKAPVFPWGRFPGTDVVLGPEMRSTGEVMGVGRTFGEAYAKALLAAGMNLPTEGRVFVSLRDQDKWLAPDLAEALVDMGYSLVATRGTHATIVGAGFSCELTYKVGEAADDVPDIQDRIRAGDIGLMLNTPSGQKSLFDERAMRLAGLRVGVPCITTAPAARALVSALRALRNGQVSVSSLQELE
jgi:carbamoyl-phosphate synthase large subunit